MAGVSGSGLTTSQPEGVRQVEMCDKNKRLNYLYRNRTYVQGWPEPYIYTAYDRIFGDFPAKITVYTPYIYGPGQPYICTNTRMHKLLSSVCNM